MAVILRIISGSSAPDMAYDGDYTSVEINNKHGYNGGIYVDGFFIYATLVVCMQMKVAAMTNTWNWISWTLWVLSIVGFLFFSWCYAQFSEVFDWYKVVDFAMGTGVFYQGCIVMVWLMFMVDLVMRTSSEFLFPSSMSALRELETKENTEDRDSRRIRKKYNR